MMETPLTDIVTDADGQVLGVKSGDSVSYGYRNKKAITQGSTRSRM